MPGLTVTRGYGAAHRRERAKWARKVKRGVVACWRCGHLIEPGTDWDMGHVDGDKSQYAGPEHRACNRATAGRQPNAVAPPPALRQSRRW